MSWNFKNLCLILQFPYNFGIINVGAPACGANAAMRAFVRLALTSGYGVMGIHYGFDGLVHDNVRINTNAHTFLKHTHGTPWRRICYGWSVVSFVGETDVMDRGARLGWIRRNKNRNQQVGSCSRSIVCEKSNLRVNDTRYCLNHPSVVAGPWFLGQGRRRQPMANFFLKKRHENEKKLGQTHPLCAASANDVIMYWTNILTVPKCDRKTMNDNRWKQYVEKTFCIPWQ